MDAYIYKADCYCSDCALALQEMIKEDNPEAAERFEQGVQDSEEYPVGPFPDGGGEADSPQHCGNQSCMVFLMNPLTDEGKEFVIDILGRYLKEGDEELGASYLAGELNERIQNDDSLVQNVKDRYIEWVDHYDYVFSEEAERRHSNKTSIKL